MSDAPAKAAFPAKLAFLFRPKRYKVLYGGRGGAKSWGIARALLIIAARQKKRILCARELQESIADSVHELLKGQVNALGLQGFYEVQKTRIVGQNGSEFVFDGLKHNVNSLKSFEGADIVWVEEANNVSKRSWDVLIPTIRANGSEIWISFNPELATDETYKRFVINPPSDAEVVKIGWRDNPWFPDVLQREMLDLKARDYNAYLNVWEGETVQVLEGAIYAKELKKVLEDGRRTKVRYDRSLPVYASWDLGRSDMTAIWFFQHAPFERRYIDYYENRGYAIDHYINVCQGKGYNFAAHYLPHDAKHKTIIHKLSVEAQMRAVGWTVKVVPNLKRSVGISACRLILPTCVFDEEKTAEGWNALSHYCYKVDDETGQFSKEPDHNWASHGADAFRMGVLGSKDPRKTESTSPQKSGNMRSLPHKPSAGSWMR